MLCDFGQITSFLQAWASSCRLQLPLFKSITPKIRTTSWAGSYTNLIPHSYSSSSSGLSGGGLRQSLETIAGDHLVSAKGDRSKFPRSPSSKEFLRAGGRRRFSSSRAWTDSFPWPEGREGPGRTSGMKGINPWSDLAITNALITAGSGGEKHVPYKIKLN